MAAHDVFVLQSCHQGFKHDAERRLDDVKSRAAEQLQKRVLNILAAACADYGIFTSQQDKP